MIASAAAAAAAAAAVVASQARAALAPALMPTGVPADIPIAAPAPAVAVPPVERQVEALVPAATPSVLPAAQVRPITGSPDDLTRISVIDGGMAGQLQKLNVTQFSQIAAWRKSDVAAMSGALGFQGRIEQENWIEQAQILANGGETYYSARRARAPSTVSMAAPASAPAAPVVLPMPDASAATAPRVAERSAFAEAPAALRPATMPTPAAVMEPIKAAIVATTTPVVAAVSAALATPAVAATPSEPTIPEAQATASPLRPTMAPQRDNLQRIGGINAEIEKLLAVQGITRFNQVSSWGTTDVERFDRLLGSQGRITRENWVEQAQILGKGGDTAHSRDFDRRSTEMPRDAAARPKSITEAIKANTGAAPSRPDITGLRSVRSDAYRQPALDANTAAAAAAAAGAGSAKVVRSAEIDDLKRIRGIGVLIEKRLNSVGIVSYGQIAEWTNEDIDRVSASLDFKGRIERENWVEQARILASGGQTEFSRRVDRGEVETSKAKS